MPNTGEPLSEPWSALPVMALCPAQLPSAGPVAGATHARVRAPVGARGRGPQPAPEPEVRLHTPIPQVVIVRVIGAVDRCSAPLLAQRVAQQLDRAAHVVLDLGEVAVLACNGVETLIDLHREAHARGRTLYIAGVDHEPISRALRRTGVDQMLTLAPSADAVIALLHRHQARPAGPRTPGRSASPRRLHQRPVTGAARTHMSASTFHRKAGDAPAARHHGLLYGSALQRPAYRSCARPPTSAHRWWRYSTIPNVSCWRPSWAPTLHGCSGSIRPTGTPSPLIPCAAPWSSPAPPANRCGCSMNSCGPGAPSARSGNGRATRG